MSMPLPEPRGPVSGPLPEPRGPVSGALLAALRTSDPSLVPTGIPLSDDPLADEDVQLALWAAQELHYRGFAGVPEEWEWEPAVLRLRGLLEDALLAALRRDVSVAPSDRPVAERLVRIVESDDGPSLSRFIQTRASRGQFLEWAVHRSLYQLKEADPHTWALPRLPEPVKAALWEIQVDEYGGGRVASMHCELYRQLLRGVGLDDTYGAYIDAVPATTLAISTVMSLFGLRRSLRGALVGHLAAYEMTSSEPCRRYGKGLRRLGGSDGACAFFDEHVLADAVHEQLAAHDLCGRLAQLQPALTEDILFGAAACLYAERRCAETIVAAWSAGRSSLRHPVTVPETALPVAS